MPRRKSSSKRRSRSRSPKRSRTRSRSRKGSRSHKDTRVMKYLQGQHMDVSPFITPKSDIRNLSSGLFASDYKPLFTDRSRYVDRYKFNPFSPDTKGTDIFQNLTSDNEYMKRLLDLHREGQSLIVDTGGEGSSGNPLTITDVHPNPLIPEKEKAKQSGGAHQIFSNFIGQSPFGTAFMPHRTGSTTLLRSFQLTPPRTPQYLKNRIKNFDQMVLKTDVKDKETAKRLHGSNYMVVSNPDSFDPDKEYLFAKRDF